MSSGGSPPNDSTPKSSGVVRTTRQAPAEPVLVKRLKTGLSDRPEAQFGASQFPDSPVSSDLITHNLVMPSFLKRGHFDPLSMHPAEKFAWTLLHNERLSAEDLVQLFDLLPHERSPRAAEGVSFGSGAYVHFGTAGLRNNAKVFPLSTMCFALWLRHVKLLNMFTSCVVFDDNKAELHRDLRNSPLSNLIVPLTRFRGGLLWVEGEGTEERTFGKQKITGVPVHWAGGAIVLAAGERAHCVLPWSGRRLVLVGFNIRFAERLARADRRFLLTLGFPLDRTALSNLRAPPSPDPPDRPEPAATSTPLSPLQPSRAVPLFIELCAGSALLSAAARDRGYSILPVDWGGNKHRSFAHTLQLDLRKESTWTFVKRVFDSRRVVWVHVAPPCGTASRARGIGAGPKPLRSMTQPWGLSSLCEGDRARVDSANAIYKQCADFCSWMLNCQPATGFTVENPLHSWLWHLPPFQALLQKCALVSFDACLHGSRRNKATALLTNIEGVGVLSGPCPGCPSHEPWGRTTDGYATSVEAAYPRLLCDRILQCVDVFAAATDAAPTPQAVTPLAEARAAAQKQPRGRRFAPIISEFSHTVSVQAPCPPVLDQKNCLTAVWHKVPSGSKLLRVSVERGGKDTRASLSQSLEETDPSEQAERFFVFGVFRSPETFLREACLLKHPFDVARALPDCMVKALFKILVDGPVSVIRTRLEKLKLWRSWAEELAPAEAKLRENMAPSVKQVLGGKRTLLLNKIAASLDWPDHELHRDLSRGFKLTGYLRPTGIFQPDEKPAYSTEQDFWDGAAVLRSSLWDKVEGQVEPEYSQALWDLTLEEADKLGKGWLEGPLSRDQLDDLFPEGWSPCRRFAVWQGKWRPIDDFSECGINACFGCFERISLKALDEIT